MPQIRIESQPAKIDIHTTPGQQSIQQPGPNLDLQQRTAEIHIERTSSQLTIDQTQAWADMNMKPFVQFSQDIAQTALQNCFKGIQRRIQDGDELMRIENGGNAIADIAKRNGYKPEAELTMGELPSANSVKIHYEPTKLDIQWDIHQPINNTKARKPIIDYQPSQVNVQLKQYANVKIDFANLKYVGINYEQVI